MPRYEDLAGRGTCVGLDHDVAEALPAFREERPRCTPAAEGLPPAEPTAGG